MAETKYEQPKEGVAITKENGGAPSPAGLWVHPQSGQQQITLSDPLWGDAQSQAFARLGFVFQRPAKEGEVVTMPEMAIQEGDTNAGAMKGIQARLDKLEGVAEENKSLQAEIDILRKEKEARAEADRLDAQKVADKAQADADAKAKKEAEKKAKEEEGK